MNSLVLFAVLCGLAVAHAQTSSTQWTRPKFCRTLDCPKYEVVRKLPGTNIELRKYDASRWVATDMYAMSMQGNNGFWTLFNYIEGANADKAKIPMTAPVLMRITPGEGPFCKSNFTMGFYLPWNRQAAAARVPSPTNRAAYIKSLPALQVWVLSFGGTSNEAMDKAKATELMTKLRAAGQKFDASSWWTAGYNSPFDLIDRHNEVWVRAL